MNGIFISYRRDDSSGYAGRLYDRLAAHFGADRVFMDVEGIEPGADFVEAIDRAIGTCQILIVIIGKEWLAADSNGHRRIDDAADFVRVETVMALSRGIRVVPVLVEGAAMPRIEELPMELAPLVRRQAIELSHKQWDATSAELIHTLEKILDRELASEAEVAAPAMPRGNLDWPRAQAVPDGVPPGRAQRDSANVANASARPGRAAFIAGAIAIAAILVMLTVRWYGRPPAASPPVLAVTPDQLQFSEAVLHEATGPTEITLQNRGGSAMHMGRAKVDGAHATDFSLVDDRCSGRELQPAGSCTLNVAFAATAAGIRTAAVVIQYDEARGPVVIGLQGRGALPMLAASPPPVAPPTSVPMPQPQATPPSQSATPSTAASAAPVPTQAQQNASAQASVSVPTPSRVAPSHQAPLAVPSGTPSTSSAKPGPAGASVASSPATDLVSVPNVVGRSRGEAVAALRKMGLEADVVEAREDARGAGSDTVVGQLPSAGERVNARDRVQLQTARNTQPRGALPALQSANGFPRVGDSWQYRYRSMWRNVEARTYAHQVNAASPREVRETMSFSANGTTISDTKSFSADARLVEWRGQGYYIVEFNPFLQALGSLKPGMSWKSLATPLEDPFLTDWYTQGRATEWENIAVPAGTFRALRVEINSNRNARASSVSEPARVLYVVWYAPEARRAVRRVRTVFTASGNKIAEDTFELTQYALK